MVSATRSCDFHNFGNHGAVGLHLQKSTYPVSATVANPASLEASKAQRKTQLLPLLLKNQIRRLTKYPSLRPPTFKKNAPTIAVTSLNACDGNSATQLWGYASRICREGHTELLHGPDRSGERSCVEVVAPDIQGSPALVTTMH